MNDQLKNDPRYINHESRPDLAGEHPQGDRYQFYAFLMFTAAVLVDHFFLGWASGFRSVVPFGARLPIALLIILFGLFLSLSGIHTVFSEYTEQPRMITSGLFSFVRHPVYLGRVVGLYRLARFLTFPFGVSRFYCGIFSI